jgi:hypothetical protein
VRARLVVALAVVTASFSCGHSSPPPERVQSADATDGGLPLPPPGEKKGVIVPADMGLGPGTPGASPAPRAPAPSMGAPGVTN